VARAGESLVAERIVWVLADRVGYDRAQEIATGSVLTGQDELDGLDLDELRNPRNYLGSAGELVDRALAAHAAHAAR
jgi:hypothetical protein